jgi:hypothetical protein
MKKEHIREAIQLLWVANQYYDLAMKIKSDKKLTAKDLHITVNDLADKCQSISDINNQIALLMKINAHLGSCAVRLNTIDEILGRSYTSSRWFFYKGLLDKKDKLQASDIVDNLNIIIHCLMRHNIAHREDPPGNPAYKKMRESFNRLSIGKLLCNMRHVKEDIEADLRKHGVKI